MGCGAGGVPPLEIRSKDRVVIKNILDRFLPRAGAFIHKHLWGFIVFEIVAIYIFIYLTAYYDIPRYSHHYFRFLALVPIYQAGVAFGYNGGIISGILVSVFYMPYMKIDKVISGDPHGIPRAIMMIVFINAFGIFVGGMIGRSKKMQLSMNNLSAATIAIMRETDEKSAIMRMAAEAMSFVEAESCAALVKISEEGITDWRMFAVDRGSEPEEVKYFSAAHPLVWSAREGREIISCAMQSDDRFACCPDDAPKGPAMVLPVIYEGESYGSLFLIGKRDENLFTNQDYSVALALAGTAGAAAHNIKQERRRQEQELAGKRMRDVFSRFVSASVADYILENPESLNGKWHDVTALVCDLRDFTGLSEKLHPAHIVRQLNQYFTRMTDAVFENNGTIDKFVGDCIIAYWGAPHPDAEHAVKAARTALRMSEELENLNAEWRLSNDVEFKAGVALHTCVALIGNIGSEEKKSFTIMGEDVEAAVAIEALTKKYGVDIIATAATAERISGIMDVSPIQCADEGFGPLYALNGPANRETARAI